MVHLNTRFFKKNVFTDNIYLFFKNLQQQAENNMLNTTLTHVLIKFCYLIGVRYISFSTGIEIKSYMCHVSLTGFQITCKIVPCQFIFLVYTCT